MRRVLTSALIATLLSLALTAVLWAGHRVAGLPFLPFEAFDWLARRLPGAMVTWGIDTMASVIRALDLGETSRVAKVGEQALAVGLFLGTVVCVAVAALLAPWPGEGRFGWGRGLVAGAVVGASSVVVTLAGTVPPAGLVAGAAWVTVLAMGWGAALGYARPVLGGGDVAPGGAGADGAARRRGGQLAGGAGGLAGAVDGAVAVDRRRFLVRLGGATAAVTVTGAAVGWLLGGAAGRRRGAGGEPWSSRVALPNRDAGVEPVPGTRPELTPVAEHYRIDINTLPPRVDGAEWRLGVGGLVEQPLELTLAELRAYDPLHLFITLECISNPVAGDLISTTRWTGVSLQRLLPDLGLRDGATHLRFRSVDGFDEVLPLAAARDDERVMLTYAWDGLPLPVEHGYPLRLYWPDRFGMKQPKWIDSVEAIGEWVPGYWVRRGWDAEAIMKATSVIDTVAVDAAFRDDDGRMRVPVGGIAFAGDRGVAAVEVRVDDGPWRPARVREPLSRRTWALWRYDWVFDDGPHTLTVRCRTGRGELQVAEATPIRPDGATGYHSVDL